MLNRFRWLSVLAVTLFGFSLGCSTTLLQERKEYSEIQAGRRTLVLIRITMKLPDGTPWFRDDLIGDPQCFPSKLIGFGDFDTGGELKPTEPYLLVAQQLRTGLGRVSFKTRKTLSSHSTEEYPDMAFPLGGLGCSPSLE